MKKTIKKEEKPQVQACGECGIDNYFYSDLIKDHFLNPRNFLIDERNYQADGFGFFTSPVCGDTISLYLKIYTDSEGIERIKECKWQTFGCAGVLSTTSLMSVLVTENKGMSLKQAKRLKFEEILEKLGGLPTGKHHCAVLGIEVLKIAIEDYKIKKLRPFSPRSCLRG